LLGGALRRRFQEAERLDEHRARAPHFPGDPQHRRLLLGVVKADDQRRRVGLDAFEPGEEIHVPPVAAEFSVGHGFEADRLLALDRLPDRGGLDLP
jgi:hypothetical protein